MKLRIIGAILALIVPFPALADCTDSTCASLQKILDARSGNFSKIKGKPTLDQRGDPVWVGTQPIAGLIGSCSIYRRGENARYEYRCDSAPSQSLDDTKKLTDAVKAAFQAADPNLVWLDDPQSMALGEIDGFHGTQGWYGGFSKNKTVVVKVEMIVSETTGSTTVVTVFAKPITRRDLK
jgi:hypothetical protein